MKKIISILLIVFSIMLSVNCVIADSNSQPWVKSSIKGLGTSEDMAKAKSDSNIKFSITNESFTLIERHSARILDIGNGYINMYSNLVTTTIPDSVTFKVSLEQYDGNNYSIVNSWNVSGIQQYGSYIFDKNYKVTSGNNYRITVEAIVVKDGVIERSSLTTSYITVE